MNEREKYFNKRNECYIDREYKYWESNDSYDYSETYDSFVEYNTNINIIKFIRKIIKKEKIMRDEDIVLRQLQNNDSDYKKLENWYQKKEIYSHFEQRKLNYDEIKNKYYPRTLKDANIPVFMIEYENNPIGIIQYQKINDENKKLYELEPKNAYEVDIFIGEILQHNKGIGRRSINLLSKYLFKHKKADLIVMCPLSENYSAIKCYKNCNFKTIKSFKTEDTIGELQEFLLMIRDSI